MNGYRGRMRKRTGSTILAATSIVVGAALLTVSALGLALIVIINTL